MTVPNSWHESIVKTLYKGKGDKLDPNKYRGIALLNSMFKILATLINRRIVSHVFHHLPASQYAYQEGKDTRMPLTKLIQRVRTALAQPRGHLYVIFVDFVKAFDCVDRRRLLGKLKDSFGVRGKTLGLIANILKGNRLKITDGYTATGDITQTKGVQQGDSLSPSLFILYLADLPRAIQDRSDANKALFADDLEMDSCDIKDLQKATKALEEWCKDNKLAVNLDKTKVIKFRKGGRLARNDKILFNGEPVEFVSSYEYLGITLQSRLTFTEHIKKIKRRMLMVTGSLRDLRSASTSCALKIFDMKILPAVTYCLDLYAADLSINHLLELDKIKSAFIKRTLGLHRSSSSTLAHAMISTPFLCESLKRKNYPFNNDVWKNYEEIRDEKLVSYAAEYGTEGPAFQSDDWKKPQQKNRDILTRTTAHGFHHLLCQRQKCHQVCEDCICVLCDNPTSIYHVLYCAARGNDSLPTFIHFLEGINHINH